MIREEELKMAEEDKGKVEETEETPPVEETEETPPIEEAEETPPVEEPEEAPPADDPLAALTNTVDELAAKLAALVAEPADESEETLEDVQQQLADAKADLVKTQALAETGAGLLPAYVDRVAASEDAEAVKASIAEIAEAQKADLDKLGVAAPVVGDGGNGPVTDAKAVDTSDMSATDLIVAGLKTGK